jgi:hypothetical protein
MRIGFTTGSVHKYMNPLSLEAIDFFRELGCNAIELSALKTPELEGIDKLSRKDLEGFDYVSLHAPNIDYDHKATSTLERIEYANTELKFDAVVMHADKIKNICTLIEYRIPYAIENTDNTCSFGTNTKDMENILKKFNSPMVLDVLHAYSIEKNFNIGKEMIKQFENKIIQIHLSGYNHKTETRHTCLYQDGPEELIELTPKDKAIILESTGSFDEIKKEWEYISRKF